MYLRESIEPNGIITKINPGLNPWDWGVAYRMFSQAGSDAGGIFLFSAGERRKHLHWNKFAGVSFSRCYTISETPSSAVDVTRFFYLVAINKKKRCRVVSCAQKSKTFCFLCIKSVLGFDDMFRRFRTYLGSTYRQ